MKLRQKMEEVRSTMVCDCGKKHKRFATDRELSSARYCRKCNTHHAAQNVNKLYMIKNFSYLSGLHNIGIWKTRPQPQRHELLTFQKVKHLTNVSNMFDFFT